MSKKRLYHILNRMPCCRNKQVIVFLMFLRKKMFPGNVGGILQTDVRRGFMEGFQSICCWWRM